jgi:hypothetical protein
MISFSVEKSFLQRFLKTIGRLCDSCTIKIEDDQIYSISSSSDNIVILYIKGILAEKQEEPHKINIIDIQRFLCGLDCLDSKFIEIIINENYLKCQTKDVPDKTHFKYHLVDDSVMSKTPFSLKKISNLKFDTEFSIPLPCQNKIMSAYSFSPDVSKIYFKENEGSIYAEINDLTQYNKDSVEFKICDKYIGDSIKQPTPISIELFKNLIYTKNSSINVKINNEYKVFVFNVKEDEFIDVKYITSALVK